MPEHICPTHTGKTADGKSREESMVTIARDEKGKPTVFCDACIAPLVKALNDAGIETVWSCCGHGFRPGMVGLADGRQLVIMPDLESAHNFENACEELWPLSINGETKAQAQERQRHELMAAGHA